MGKGDTKDRKAYKASSSAQAAEFLASRGAGAGGAGFGGFSGGAPLLPGTAGGFAFGAAAAARLAPTANPAAANASTSGSVGASAGGLPGDIQLSGQLDGEIAQCLRHLTKKDSVTKLKALQTFRTLIQDKPASALSLALPPWVFLYQRLATDSSRNVRTEAATTLGLLVGQVGKAVMPHLKPLMGPWWLAQFDPHADAASAARSSFQSCFPGKKQTEALLFCCQDLLTFLTEQATSSAQQLGDARKDTPEEMEERYERVVSASLLSLGTLLQVITNGTGTSSSGSGSSSTAAGSTQQTPASSKQQGQVWTAVATLLTKPGYIKSCLGSKSHLIRSATYSFIYEVVTCLSAGPHTSASGSTGSTAAEGSTGSTGSQAADGEGSSGGADDECGLVTARASAAAAAGSAEVAGAVLGALTDKEAGGHGLMWAMILSYVKVLPSSWDSINLRKMFLPRLTAFLRNGCFGSHTVSWPSLLPLISLLPKSVILPSAEIPAQLLEATWAGLLEPGATREGRAAGCTAYLESTQWLLVVATQQAAAAGADAGAAGVYRTELLQRTVCGKPLEAALGGGDGQAEQEAGHEVMVGLVGRLAKAAGQQQGTAAAAALLAVQAALEAGLLRCIRAALTSDPANEVTFAKCEKLLASLKTTSPETAQVLGTAVIRELAAAMTAAGETTASGQLPAAASQLLAVLIRTHGALGDASSSSINAGSGPASSVAQPGAGAAPGVAAVGLGLNSLLTTCLSSPLDSPSTSAHLHVLLSWLLSSASPQQDWITTINTFTGLSLTVSSTSHSSSNGFHSDLASAELSRGLQLTQLLTSCLAEVSGSQEASITSQHWQPVLDALACALASPEALDALAGSFVLPVLPDGSHDSAAAVTHVTEDAGVKLLVALLTGSGGRLLSSETVQHVLGQLVRLLVPDGGSSTNSSAGLLAVGQLSCEACAALHVGCSYLAAAAKETASGAIPSATAGAVAAFVSVIAQLTWALAASTPTKHTYHSSLKTGDAVSEKSDSEVSEDGQEEEGHVHAHRQPLVSLDNRLETDEWLSVAFELAVSAWQGRPLVQVASKQLPPTSFASLCADLSAVLVPYVRASSAATLQQAASMVSAHVQGVVQTLERAAAVTFVQQLLTYAHDTLAEPQQSAASGTGLAGRGLEVGLQHLKLATLLAHLVHALGVELVMEAAPSTLPASHVVVHVLCAESAVGLLTATGKSGAKSKVGAPGLQELRLQQQAVRDVSSGAARALLERMCEQVAQSDDAQMNEAVRLLYNGACGKPCSSNSMQYGQDVMGRALLSWLQHVSCTGNGSGLTVVERFSSSHLLPAATALPNADPAAASSQLPQDIMLSVLSRVATVLRSSQAAAGSHGSSFSQVACSLINRSLSLTPVTLSPTLDVVGPLQAATACFPTPLEPPSSAPDAGVHNPAARMTCTDQESQLLLKLLKHQVVRRGAVAAVTRATGSPAGSGVAADGLNSETVQEAVAKLGLVAVSFCGSQLQAAEWHTLLSDMQSCLTEVVTCIRSVCSTRLSPAIKTAAQAVLGDNQQDGMTGVVAVQLLRQLEQRGVLSQHPSHASLVDDVSSALSDVSLNVSLQSVLQSVRALLKQLQYNSTVKMDQLPEGIVIFQQKYRSLFADVCEQLLQLVLALGIANYLCSVAGKAAAGQLSKWMAAHFETLETAGTATCGFLHLSVRPGGAGLVSAAYSALAHAEAWVGTLDMGLSTLDGMLSLALLQPPSTDFPSNQPDADTPTTPMLSAAAYISLLHAPESVTSRLTVAVDDSQAGEEQEYEQGNDPVTYLMHMGLHPELAQVVGAASASISFSTRLTGWAILLSHLAASTSTAPRVVRQALGDIPHLVPTLLHDLLKCLPVAEYSASSRNAAARRANSSSSSSTLATLDSSGTSSSGAAPSDLRTALRDAGFPTGLDAQAVAGRVLFGGVLHVLPASARTWFGDLRDRGTALAVEAYTAAVVSPSLLAMEMQDVQARGSDPKSDQFSIRVNTAAREVVAQMVVEEGSSLELAIKLPTSLPLKPPEVECRKRVGVNDTRMRKWLLSISSFLRINNRGVADAINMWRTNVESEFAGVEPCLICYSVVATTNSALPRLQCHTCQVRFHPGCLYKWFKSSGKSVCPHCQSPW